MDPNAGPVQRFAYELRKLRQEAGGLTYREMARRAHYSVTTLSQAAAGEQLPSLSVSLAYVAACGGDPARWERLWREASEEAALRERAGDAGRSPYQGLARFEPEDHDRFFGREELVARLGRLTAERRVSAVFGPSGCGKSSLLRAGLIPSLRERRVVKVSAIRVLTPGDHPARTHAQVLRPAAGEGDTVVVVDQFEELFTLCREPAERAAFIDRLLTAREPGSRLRVVIAVRADFYGRCAEHRGLADALSDSGLLVGPMTPAELREAVVRPAQAAGLIVERELTGRLVREVADEPGGLPLMSHVLHETWRRRRGRALTVQAYEAAGGVHGAIAKTAEEVYTRLSAEDAKLAHLVLLRLITPGEGSPDTRRPVDRMELDFAPVDEVALVLDRLARARLLILDDSTVDLAHEALITSWPRLRAWVEEARDRLRAHRRLTEAAHTWESLARDPGALYRGTRLATTDEHLADQPLTPVEQAFLTASRTTRTREVRRRRTLLTTLAALLALALVAGVTAWQQSRTSDRRHRESEARRIAALADSMRATDPVTAARLSVASWSLARTVETRSAVLSALNSHEQDAFTLPERDDRLVVRRLTGDGRALVSAARDRVRVWDLRTHRLTHTYPGPGERLSGPDRDVISPDGRMMALSGEKSVALWDIRTGRLTGHLRAELPSPVEFSRDGRSLTVQVANEVQVWDVPRRRLRLRVALGGEGNTTSYAAISADGRRLATCGTRRAVQIWEVARRVTLRTPRTAENGRGFCSRTRFAFSPDGTSIALESPTEVLVRNIASGRELARLDTQAPADVRFSPDGAFIAALDEQGQVLMWRLASPGTAPVFRHILGSEAADHYEVDFAAGEIRYLDGSRTAVRSLTLGSATTSAWHRQTTDDALLSRDGRTSATLRAPAGGKGSVRLWHTRSGKALLTLPDKPCPVEESAPEAAADAPGELGADEETATVIGGQVQAGSSDVDCLNLMALSADGRSFAYARSGTLAGTNSSQRIAVWDVSTRHKRANITIRPDRDRMAGVDALALSPDGRTLYVSRTTTEQVLEVWDVQRSKRLRTLNDVPAGGMAVRNDQRLLVTGQDQVIDLRTGQTQYRALGEGVSDVLAFSPDGARFAAGTALGHVTVWDGNVRRRLGVASAEPGESVTALVFSPDGSTLAVADSGGTVQLWDVASSRPLGSAFPTPGDLPRALAFNRDGTTLSVAGAHVRLRTYDISPAQVARQVCARTGSGLSPVDWKTYLPDTPFRRTC